ncbi:hypothetical protein MY11210_006396 [Beauveria gryllotalpidicola]
MSLDQDSDFRSDADADADAGRGPKRKRPLSVSILQNLGHPLPSGGALGAHNSFKSLPSEQGSPGESTQHSRPQDQLRTSQREGGFVMAKQSSFTPSSQNAEFPTANSAPMMHDRFQQRPMSTMSTASHPDSAAHEYYQHPSANPPHHAGAQGADQDLPPYDLVYSLVDLYFKKVNTWCPILHRKTTLDTLFGPSALQEADLVLLHAIVATTMRYSTDVRLTMERRKSYHKTSKDKVLLYGMENSSVKSLQALVVLALDLCGSSNGPPGWNIMALITRSVVQLGLAVETTSSMVSPSFTSIYTLRAMVLPEPKDFIEEESRRRLFWMIYLLDRYATIATAFEFALDDREIDRSLPCRYDLWMANRKVETKWFTMSDSPEAAPHPDSGATEHLGAFSYYIEVLGILSKIHKFLKQPVNIGVVEDVERWQFRYKELDSMLTSWKYGLPVHGSTVEHKLSPQIAFFVDILRALGAFWPVAQRYCNLLQRVLDEHRDSEQKGDGITPSSVKILADMRRTAFDLDFLISRQPRHATHTMSRVSSVTSARTPAPTELEYLDVFDFFNVPRLPLLGDSLSISNEAVTQPEMHPASNVNPQSGIIADFNITNFMMDVNSDWFKQEGGKFLGQG